MGKRRKPQIPTPDERQALRDERAKMISILVETRNKKAVRGWFRGLPWDDELQLDAELAIDLIEAEDRIIAAVGKGGEK